MELQKLDDLLLNLIDVFGARRIKGKAAGYPCTSQENKHSHTESIMQSLAAEGAMHE